MKALVFVLSVLLVFSSGCSLLGTENRIKTEYSWKRNGGTLEKSTVFRPINASVNVSCVRDCDGQLEVLVKKDVRLWFDETVASKNFSLKMTENQSAVFDLEFVPKEESGGFLRGYFIEVFFEGEKHRMRDSYPPRLTTTKGGLVALATWWTDSSGSSVSDARVGDYATGNVLFQVEGGDVSGRLDVVVKKDMRLLPDEFVRQTSFKIEFFENEKFNASNTFEVPFPSERALRGYFLEAYLNGSLVYRMPENYPPRLTASG